MWESSRNGIEDNVPDKIRKTSMESLKLFMDEKDQKIVDSYYEEDGENLVLKKNISSSDRDKLGTILAEPMMVLTSVSSGSDEMQAAFAEMGVPEGADPLEVLAQMPQEARKSITDKFEEKIKDMPESIVTQAGVAYVKTEYEAIGEDVDAMQMALYQGCWCENAWNGTCHHALCHLRSISFCQSGSSSWS